MTEVLINGVEYSILPLDTFSQLTLARKSAPLFLGLARTAFENNDAYAGYLQLFSTIPEEDFKLLVKAVMPYVRKKSGEVGWVSVYKNDAFLFQDLDAGVVMELLIKTIMEYVPAFISALDHSLFNTPQE